MSNYLKSLREAEQGRYTANLEAAGVMSLQDDPYASANGGRFPQAGLKFEYGHISATLFSNQRSKLRNNFFPGSS